MIRSITAGLLAAILALALAGCSPIDHEKALFYKDQGDFYYQNGKWEQARAEYLAALGVDEEFIEAYVAIGYTSRMMGKVEYIKSPDEYGRRQAEKWYREALRYTELCLEHDEGNPEAYHLQGLLWYDASRFQEAIDSFDKALDHDPHHKHANKYKSMCLFMQGVQLRGQGIEAKEKGEIEKQVELCREAVRKYEDAATAMETYLANWDKVESEKAPQESDLRNWIRVLREMAKADGAETEEARIYMNKIKNVAPALTERGAMEGSKDGQPVIRESDVAPSMTDKDRAAGQ